MQKFKTLHYLGNKEVLNNYKLGFLCSRKVPADIILKTYDWAIEQREKGVCVISGFHSKIEKDVFHYLAKGTEPIIIVLARGLYKRIPEVLLGKLHSGSLLIVSPFSESYSRMTVQNAIKRNRLIIELSDSLFIPYVRSGGMLEKLVANIRSEDVPKSKTIKIGFD